MRSSKGRQKVPMRKIENSNNLQVSFSKRRAGLFKKASEITTMCGTEIALIVFSPGQKVYAYGHPTVDEVIDRFEGNPRQPVDPAMQNYMEEQRNMTQLLLNNELMQLTADIELEEKRAVEVNTKVASERSVNWWTNPVEEIDDVGKLMTLRDSMMTLRSNIARESEMRPIEGPHSGIQGDPLSFGNQFYYGAGSSSSSAAPPPAMFRRDYFAAAAGESSSTSAAPPPAMSRRDYFAAAAGESSSSVPAGGPYTPRTDNLYGPGSSSAGGPYASRTDNLYGHGSSAGGRYTPRTDNLYGHGSSSAGGLYAPFGPGSSSAGAGGLYAPWTDKFFDPGSSSAGGAGPSGLQSYDDNFMLGLNQRSHLMLQQSGPAVRPHGLGLDPTRYVMQQPAPGPGQLGLNPNFNVQAPTGSGPLGLNLNYDDLNVGQDPNDPNKVVDFGDNPNPKPMDSWDPTNSPPGGM